MPGGIGVSVFYVFMLTLWYQTGASFLKRKKWAWWLSFILISIFCLGNFASVWSTIIYPLLSVNVNGVGIGRWISLALFIFSSYLVFTLLKPDTRKAFKNA
ncbi:hypothetical protein IMCC1989_208 [gamma proteobacterium IMCC1989]|nr:hypothetical protein IMCC1989_208 [gamma proteobacterium IMCC1989]